MFQLNKDEWYFLKSQFVTIKHGRGEHPKYLPYAFTEQGVAMLSSVLRSDTAIEVNIRIMRAFVAVRQYLSPSKCENCQLESEVRKLASYIEEILADQNDFNEEVNNALAVLQAAVFPENENTTEKRRIFNITVKGFTKES